MNRIDSSEGAAASTLEAFSPARFQTFYEVARLGSVARAASVLGRSQPAISHRLRALQDELGVELFEKVGRTLRLTEAGRRLRDACADFLTWSRVLHAAVDDDATPTGLVTIGTLPTVASNLLVEPIAELLDSCPALELAFMFDAVPVLLAALREGRADILILVGEIDTSGLELERIGTSGFAAVMSPDVAPRRKGSVSPAELRRLRYLTWQGPNDPAFEVVRRYVANQSLSNASSPRIPNIETLRSLAAAGAGYAILPSYTVASDVEANRLVALKPQGFDDQVPIMLVSRSRQLHGPGLRLVREKFATGVSKLLPSARSPRPGTSRSARRER